MSCLVYIALDDKKIIIKILLFFKKHFSCPKPNTPKKGGEKTLKNSRPLALATMFNFLNEVNNLVIYLNFIVSPQKNTKN